MSIFTLVRLFGLSIVLSACGGGGSSSSQAPSPSGGNTPTDTSVGTSNNQPNILLIISDDQGLDSSAQYSLSNNPPITPIIDQLANDGLVFDNVWATPACTPTRSTIITGQYGVNSGVVAVGDPLPDDAVTIQRFLAEDEGTANYNSGLIGKWHLGGGAPDVNHPATMGVNYFAGTLGGAISNYESWSLTTNGSTRSFDGYHTAVMTDLAIDWIGSQTQPWFLWLAYVAPHTPYHLPPDSLHSQILSGTEADIQANPRDYYLAAIEAMDTEIGRLLSTMSQSERDNTLVIYMGDNGTPRRVADASVYANGTKGTLTEGGLRVPMVVSGSGVSRQNTREQALINSTDLFATIAEVAGSTTIKIQDSRSFASLFTDQSAQSRQYIYSDYQSGTVSGWAIRDARYKLIATLDGQRQLYDLPADPSESSDLLTNNGDYTAIVERLAAAATAIRQTDDDGSGEIFAIDITGEIFTQRSGNCQAYINDYQATSSDLFRSVVFTANLTIASSGDKCVFQSNGVPNHDFNDGQGFPNNLTEQSYYYEVSRNPSFADTLTALEVGDDNGLMLNGVKVDVLAAACFGVGDERTGCRDSSHPWRFDPMFPANNFRVDSHNAHVQPGGSYHYHGTPNAMFDPDNPVESPVIGFAADGFPIFGSWFNDNGVVRKAESSFRVKLGQREALSGYPTPEGDYDGSFRRDYEYIEGLGDLDECNGMQVDGVYGYFITEQFPYIMACLKGQMDSTFN